MAKKTKSKARLDRFYRIAKEQGLRSRAAFKLIQLNQRYHFLEKARVIVDLCAAPGGWLQVAARHMPAGSLLVGVDLDPIKPVQGALTFQEDIRTEACWQRIRRELKHLKADVVLNDGAPNVGSDWHKDAFDQSELCLAALRLATRLLRPGGLFITKVFRSTDYLNLLRVFGHMFGSVEANKPEASRAISAEIFVVCANFCGQERIDPAWLDSRAVFAQTERDAFESGYKVDSIRKIFERPKHRAIPDSAPSTMFRRLPLADFLAAPNPHAAFVDFNRVEASAEELAELNALVPLPEDFNDMVADLRLLNAAQVRVLLRWRQRVNTLRNRKAAPAGGEGPSDRAVKDRTEPPAPRPEPSQAAEREAKKAQPQKKRLPAAQPAASGEADELAAFRFGDFPRTFAQAKFVDLEELNAAAVNQNRRALDLRTRDKALEDVEENVDFLHQQKLLRQKAAAKAREERAKASPQPAADVKRLRSQSPWFERGIFKELEQKAAVATGFSKEAAAPAAASEHSTSSEEEGAGQSDEEVRAALEAPKGRKPLDEEEMAEIRALSRKMLRKKSRQEILDQAYNRYNYPEDPATLPRWFVEDERKAVGKIPQITKEDVQREREQLRWAQARLPMKVIEAKFRRKRKLLKRLEKAKSAAQEVIDNDTLTPLLKGKELNKIYGKATRGAKNPQKKVVVTRRFGTAAPRTKKGRKYKVVDRRLKKDTRAAKRIAKRSRKR